MWESSVSYASAGDTCLLRNDVTEYSRALDVDPLKVEVLKFDTSATIGLEATTRVEPIGIWKAWISPYAPMDVTQLCRVSIYLAYQP